MGRVDWRTSAGSLVTGSLVRRQSGRLPHGPFFGGMGGVGGSQLTGTETLEPDIEFPDAPSPRLAKKDASLSAPAIRLFSTRTCSTWFPVAVSNPAVTLMPLIPEEGAAPRVGSWSTWLQKICGRATTLLSAREGGSAGPCETPDPPTMPTPMNAVLTSLLAIEMPSMRFPGSSHPAMTVIPALWTAASRLKFGFPGRSELWMVFAWTSRLDSVLPVEGLLKYPPLAPPMSCRPVIVLPSMERVSIVLLAFPQHAASAKIPKPPASPMVFERMPIFRAMLFSEYWIGRRDGYPSSLAASPTATLMPIPNSFADASWSMRPIWLPTTCIPSIKFADALPT